MSAFRWLFKCCHFLSTASSFCSLIFRPHLFLANLSSKHEAESTDVDNHWGVGGGRS